jgi:chromosome segregation ATPase
MRQLADLRRRLGAAEGALTDALAALKRAEEAFDAASDRFDAAERALDAAREERAQARRDRYAARQAYERATATADRLARRVRETSERLDRAAELAAVSWPAGQRRCSYRMDGRAAGRLGRQRERSTTASTWSAAAGMRWLFVSP